MSRKKLIRFLTDFWQEHNVGTTFQSSYPSFWNSCSKEELLYEVEWISRFR